jgi:hypothetical protein
MLSIFILTYNTFIKHINLHKVFHLRPRSMQVYFWGFSPVLGCKIRARLKHIKTLLSCSVGRFWPGKGPGNTHPSRFGGWRRRDLAATLRSRRRREARKPTPPLPPKLPPILTPEASQRWRYRRAASAAAITLLRGGAPSQDGDHHQRAQSKYGFCMSNAYVISAPAARAACPSVLVSAYFAASVCCFVS